MFVFRNVKTFRPGRVIPLTGLRVSPGAVVTPFNGSAAMRSDGVVIAGIFVHSAVYGYNFTLEWQTDRTLSGVAPYDTDGDHATDNGAFVLSVIDCASVVVP